MDKKLIKFSLIFVTGVFISAASAMAAEIAVAGYPYDKAETAIQIDKGKKKLLRKLLYPLNQHPIQKKMKSLLHLLKAQRVVKLPNILKQIKILMKFQFPDLII